MTEKQKIQAYPSVDVAILGAAAVDWVASVTELPRRDGIAWVNDYRAYPGGSGGNLAEGIARLGKSARFLGRLGDDEGGRLLWQAFSTAGVDLTGVRVMEGQRSSACFIGVEDSGDREMYALGGVALYDAPEDIDPNWLTGVRVLALADVYPEVALKAIQELSPDAMVVFNPGGLMASYPAENLDPIMKSSQVLIVSRTEALAMTMNKDIFNQMRILSERGPQTVIQTRGSDGSYLYHHGNLTHFPPFRVHQVVDTTGAGDAFSAGLIVGMLEGLDWKDAVEIGSAVSAIKIGYKGARGGLPSREQVREFIHANKQLNEEVHE